MACSCDTITVNRVDPTKTTTIRVSYIRELKKRIRQFLSEIKKKIVDENFFGYQANPSSNSLATLAAGWYEFGTSLQKMRDFIKWLRQQEKMELLEIHIRPGTRRGEAFWADTFIASAYRKGIVKAYAELSKAKIPGYDKEIDKGVNISFGGRFHSDRIEMLYSRNYRELEGVTAEIDNVITRILSQGMAEGRNPREIARQITDKTSKIERQRAVTIARTEITRSHAEANLNEYQAANTQFELNLLSEFLTVGDEKVCARCQDLERDNPYSIDSARGIIPVHPNCRCTWIPVLEPLE